MIGNVATYLLAANWLAVAAHAVVYVPVTAYLFWLNSQAKQALLTPDAAANTRSA